METGLTSDDTTGHAIILFDGVCNLCNATVNFVIDHDPAGVFRFAALQSEPGQSLAQRNGIRIDRPESIVLIEDGRVAMRSSAALGIARHLRGGWRWLYSLRAIPRFIRDPVYELIARHRYRWFGRQETCRVPTPELMDRFL